MQTSIDASELINAVGDAIIVSDAKGAITLWNPAATRMFGFSEAEALGQSLDILIREAQRRRHREGYEQTMRTGQTRYGSSTLQVPALHKDGHTISIAFTVALLCAADGAVTGIAAVMRDETVRWNEERAMRRRLNELEAQVRQSTPKAAAT